MDNPSVYDHCRPTTASYPEGIYRVVGAADREVTLVRVGDADGQRVHTGETLRVSADELDGFEAARNPEGNRPLGAKIRGGVEMTYWSIRAFFAQLRQHPVAGLIAGVLFAFGALGDRVISVPDTALTVATIAGAVVLIAIGSGRLP